MQFVMDLEVPGDFTPVNADGETESFQLVSVAEVHPLNWFPLHVFAECWQEYMCWTKEEQEQTALPLHCP